MEEYKNEDYEIMERRRDLFSEGYKIYKEQLELISFMQLKVQLIIGILQTAKITNKKIDPNNTDKGYDRNELIINPRENFALMLGQLADIEIFLRNSKSKFISNDTFFNESLDRIFLRKHEVVDNIRISSITKSLSEYRLAKQKLRNAALENAHDAISQIVAPIDTAVDIGVKLLSGAAPTQANIEKKWSNDTGILGSLVTATFAASRAISESKVLNAEFEDAKESLVQANFQNQLVNLSAIQNTIQELYEYKVWLSGFGTLLDKFSKYMEVVVEILNQLKEMYGAIDSIASEKIAEKIHSIAGEINVEANNYNRSVLRKKNKLNAIQQFHNRSVDQLIQKRKIESSRIDTIAKGFDEFMKFKLERYRPRRPILDKIFNPWRSWFYQRSGYSRLLDETREIGTYSKKPELALICVYAVSHLKWNKKFKRTKKKENTWNLFDEQENNIWKSVKNKFIKYLREANELLVIKNDKQNDLSHLNIALLHGFLLSKTMARYPKQGDENDSTRLHRLFQEPHFREYLHDFVGLLARCLDLPLRYIKILDYNRNNAGHIEYEIIMNIYLRTYQLDQEKYVDNEILENIKSSLPKLFRSIQKLEFANIHIFREDDEIQEMFTNAEYGFIKAPVKAEDFVINSLRTIAGKIRSKNAGKLTNELINRAGLKEYISHCIRYLFYYRCTQQMGDDDAVNYINNYRVDNKPTKGYIRHEIFDGDDSGYHQLYGVTRSQARQLLEDNLDEENVHFVMEGEFSKQLMLKEFYNYLKEQDFVEDVTHDEIIDNIDEYSKNDDLMQAYLIYIFDGRPDSYVLKVLAYLRGINIRFWELDIESGKLVEYNHNEYQVLRTVDAPTCLNLLFNEKEKQFERLEFAGYKHAQVTLDYNFGDITALYLTSRYFMSQWSELNTLISKIEGLSEKEFELFFKKHNLQLSDMNNEIQTLVLPYVFVDQESEVLDSYARLLIKKRYNEELDAEQQKKLLDTMKNQKDEHAQFYISNHKDIEEVNKELLNRFQNLEGGGEIMLDFESNLFYAAMDAPDDIYSSMDTLALVRWLLEAYLKGVNSERMLQWHFNALEISKIDTLTLMLLFHIKNFIAQKKLRKPFIFLNKEVELRHILIKKILVHIYSLIRPSSLFGVAKKSVLSQGSDNFIFSKDEQFIEQNSVVQQLEFNQFMPRLIGLLDIPDDMFGKYVESLSGETHRAKKEIDRLHELLEGQYRIGTQKVILDSSCQETSLAEKAKIRRMQIVSQELEEKSHIKLNIDKKVYDGLDAAISSCQPSLRGIDDSWIYYYLKRMSTLEPFGEVDPAYEYSSDDIKTCIKAYLKNKSGKTISFDINNDIIGGSFGKKKNNSKGEFVILPAFNRFKKSDLLAVFDGGRILTKWLFNDFRNYLSFIEDFCEIKGAEKNVDLLQGKDEEEILEMLRQFDFYSKRPQEYLKVFAKEIHAANGEWDKIQKRKSVLCDDCEKTNEYASFLSELYLMDGKTVILFPFKTEGSSWFLGEINISPSDKNHLKVDIYAHNPFGNGEMDQDIFVYLCAAIEFKLNILTGTMNDDNNKASKRNITFQNQKSKYEARLNESDGSSSGVMIVRDALYRAYDKPIARKNYKPYPKGCEKLRTTELGWVKNNSDSESNKFKKNVVKKETKEVWKLIRIDDDTGLEFVYELDDVPDLKQLVDGESVHNVRYSEQKILRKVIEYENKKHPKVQEQEVKDMQSKIELSVVGGSNLYGTNDSPEPAKKPNSKGKEEEEEEEEDTSSSVTMKF